MEKYSYFEIEKQTQALYKEKGSKFIAYSFIVKNELEVKNCIDKLKKIEHSARHFCYAYCINADKSITRFNDDGEPANSAGKPILGQITAYNLTNVLIVVVRYFGGTKLGVGGLINAYKTAAKESINKTKIITKHIQDVFEITFEYDELNFVMRVQKELDLKIIHQKLEINCEITFSVNKNISNIALSKWNKNHKLKIKRIEIN
ncbi:MAG: IMPACT family protein [Flavobacteriales bacterium]